MGIRDFVLLGIIAVLIPLALFRPWTGVLSWAWIGYMNPHKLVWSLQHMPIAEAIAVATMMGLLGTKERRGIPWTREMVLLVALAVWFTLTTVFAWAPDPAWVQWDKVMKIILFTFITPMLIYGRARVRLLFLITALSIGFFGFKGGIFSLLTGGHYKIYGPGSSFIADNNSIGLAMAMVLPMILIAARGEANRYFRGFLYACFCLTIVAIIFTYSRGALLGLAAVLLALFWRYKTRIIIVALLVGVGFSLAKNFIPEQWYARQETTLHYQHDNSAMQRIQAWSVAKNIALSNPLFGAGFEFEDVHDPQRWLAKADFLGDWHNVPRAAHSIYFQILGEHGFVGFALYMTILLGTLWRTKRLGKLERNEESAWIGRYAKAIQYALIPYMVSGAFLSLAYFDLFYGCVVFSAILYREAQDLELARQNAAYAIAASGPTPVGRDDLGRPIYSQSVLDGESAAGEGTVGLPDNGNRPL